MPGRHSADKVRADQDRALAGYLRHEVCAYSSAHRRRIDPDRVTTVADLARVAPLSLDEMGEPADLVLHPDPGSITSSGTLELRARLAWAQVSRRLARMERGVIDRNYKPVHWVLSRGVPLGYSHRDLRMLAEVGRQGLEAAGVGVRDTIVSLLPPGPNLAYWQVLLGAQRAGVSIIGLDPRTDIDAIEALGPTVLAASGPALDRLADSGRPVQGVATVVAVAAPGDDRVPAPTAVAAGRSPRLMHWFAPAGVRSLWWECRDGEGLHTSPTLEIVQDETGELVWTSLDWRGTVFVRLATGLGGRVVSEPCAGCGHSGPRITDLGSAPSDPPPLPAVSEPAPAKRVPEPAPAAEPPAVRHPVPASPAAVEPAAVKPAAVKPATVKPATVKPAAATKPSPKPAVAKTAVSAKAEPIDPELDDIAAVLDGHEGVRAWQAELRTDGGSEELIVYLAPAGGGHPGRLVRQIDAELDVTQFVVMDHYDVADRIREHGGARVLDLRP